MSAHTANSLSIRMMREWRIDPENDVPSFDHLPLEGRVAARPLWRAAFGDPQQQFRARFDLLCGTGRILPTDAQSVVKAIS